MSFINIEHLTFSYAGSFYPVFEDVTFHMDTDWKVGLIGRNGKGKTTLLKLLEGKYEYQGTISKNVEVDYFPFIVKNNEKLAIEIVSEIVPNVEEWKIMKELNLLKAEAEILYRNFNLLSGGEQVKILLISLFLKENNFLLIDEPTNHLDNETKEHLAEYLSKKKGFLIVSHDRNFLDKVVNHIIAINHSNIEIRKGNFSSWKENKDKQDNFEITQNEKLQKDITRLEIASKNTANWSDKIEKSKYHTSNSGSSIDRGYVGHQAAKMMKKSKVLEKRIQKSIEQKSTLLNNIDKNDTLKIVPLQMKKNEFVLANDLQVKYHEKTIFSPLNFTINQGDRIALIGKNGIGKSSILKLVKGETIAYEGTLKIANDLKISYVSQHTDNLKGSLKDYARENKIEESIMKSMLSKMGFSNTDFDKEIQKMSEGQKKKVLIAKSITERANLYIWDEPLNYIDILTRMQIEECILKYNPTILFVEHDEKFIKNVATKVLQVENQKI